MRTLVIILLAAGLAVLNCGCGKPKTAPEPRVPDMAAAEATQESPPSPNAEVAQAAETDDVAALLEENCTRCHGLDRIKQYDDEEPWKGIVDRMINERGAKVTPENAAKIVAYLEKKYPRK